MPVKSSVKKPARSVKKSNNTKMVVSKSVKTAAKPLKEAPKKASEAETAEGIMSALVMIKLWFEGWKKTFVLRGRTSRFELWNFLFFNSILAVIVQLKCSYFLSERFLRDAAGAGYSLVDIDKYISYAEIGFYLVVLLPLFPLGSILIRRMHDVGRLAWDNYLKPVFMSMVLLSVLLYTLELLLDTDYANTVILLQVCFMTTVYGMFFYAIKFLIMTLFYEGDKGRNAYGESKYGSAAHEEWALNLCCLWALFIFTVMLLYFIMWLI